MTQMKLFHATGSGWTKERVFEQLADSPKQWRTLGFKAEHIPDDVVQEWVDAENDLKDQFLSEEAYITAIENLNRTLITKTKRAILEN